MKYACIERHRGEFQVRLMCRSISVSPAGFYAAARRARHGAKNSRRLLDERLAGEIRLSTGDSEELWQPACAWDLRDLGFAIGEKRVARVMRQKGIHAKQARRFRVHGDSFRGPQFSPECFACDAYQSILLFH